MGKYNFTTVVSSQYLFKFLVMYRSLLHHCTDFVLFVMCLENDVFEILQNNKLKNVVLLRPSDIKIRGLEVEKEQRPYIEYCWLLKSVTLNFVMNNSRDAEYYAHLDADLCFFNNPVSIFDESPESSLFLVDHNNSKNFLYTYETSGRFNTGFVGCKNSKAAKKAVNWWQEQCFKSCSAVADPKKKIFGDQRYVEKWPRLFSKTHIIKSKGVNVAIWNIEGYKTRLIENEVYVNNDKLIIYHFSGFCILNEKEFTLTFFNTIDNEPLNLIYLPYMLLLNQEIKTIKAQYPNFIKGFVDKSRASMVHYYKLNI